MIMILNVMSLDIPVTWLSTHFNGVLIPRVHVKYQSLPIMSNERLFLSSWLVKHFEQILHLCNVAYTYNNVLFLLSVTFGFFSFQTTL